MNYTRDILVAASQSGIGDAYYKLCKEHPLLPGTSVKKVPYKDILSAAVGVVLLSKLAGPGIVFKLGGLPDGVCLNFIIQSGGWVETHFVIAQAGQEQHGTFAILCNEALKHAGQPAPVPAYPRPVCSSATELVTVFCVFQELILALSKAFHEAG
ncbi:hypothetical protein [Rhodanobacter sp. BL-MT-08]